MRDDDFWFPNVKGNVGVTIKSGFKKAGIGWASFHHFRHFGACQMINNEEDIALCEPPMVGTQRYSHKDDLCPC
jgi:integrase